MKNIKAIFLWVLIANVLVVGSTVAQMKITPLPEFEKKDQVVEDEIPSPVRESSDTDQTERLTISQMLAETEGYQVGDPLNWEIVAPVIDQIREYGVLLPDSADMQPLFLNEKDLFYRMITARNGKQFFKDLAKAPEAIDRAERYLKLPNGRKELGFIMTRKGGAEFFTDMVTNQNGRATARMISSRPGDHQFDQPTGKIYLESQFIDYLKKVTMETKPSSKSAEPTNPRKYD